MRVKIPEKEGEERKFGDIGISAIHTTWAPPIKTC